MGRGSLRRLGRSRARTGRNRKLTCWCWAAASLADVMPAVGSLWAERWEGGGGRPNIVFSFDATSRLARQAEINPAADVFVGADMEWVDWLAGQGRLAASSVRRVVGNTLVTVVPRDLSLHSLDSIQSGLTGAAGTRRRERTRRKVCPPRAGDRGGLGCGTVADRKRQLRQECPPVGGKGGRWMPR